MEIINLSQKHTHVCTYKYIINILYKYIKYIKKKVTFEKKKLYKFNQKMIASVCWKIFQ